MVKRGGVEDVFGGVKGKPREAEDLTSLDMLKQIHCLKKACLSRTMPSAWGLLYGEDSCVLHSESTQD